MKNKKEMSNEQLEKVNGGAYVTITKMKCCKCGYALLWTAIM